MNNSHIESYNEKMYRERIARLEAENGRLKALIDSADNPGGSLMWTSDHDKILARELAALQNTVPPVIQMEAYAFCGDPEDNLPMTETEKIMKGVAIIIGPLIEKITAERDEALKQRDEALAKLEKARS